MNDDAAFIETILANPDDDSYRLIYSDWLEERGDPRGEYLRLAVALAQADRTNKSREQLEKRLQALLKKLDARWAKAVCFRPIATIEDLVDFLREFHRHWRKSAKSTRERIPADLPDGLKLIYQELGALFHIQDERPPFGAQDHLVSPNGLKRVDGSVTFAGENSGNWSCRFPLGQPDPPVYSDAEDLVSDQPKGFQKICDSLNHFLITLCLQEAVMSAPYLVSISAKTVREALKVQCRPLWLGGRYVYGDPSHNFYAAPEDDIIVLEHCGLWLGSHSDAVLKFIKAGVKYTRIG